MSPAKAQCGSGTVLSSRSSSFLPLSPSTFNWLAEPQLSRVSGLLLLSVLPSRPGHLFHPRLSTFYPLGRRQSTPCDLQLLCRLQSTRKPFCANALGAPAALDPLSKRPLPLLVIPISDTSFPFRCACESGQVRYHGTVSEWWVPGIP